MRINETKIKSDPKEGKIAINSPLGKALLGHVVGDVVTVVTPNRSYDVTIKNVE